MTKDNRSKIWLSNFASTSNSIFHHTPEIKFTLCWLAARKLHRNAIDIIFFCFLIEQATGRCKHFFPPFNANALNTKKSRINGRMFGVRLWFKVLTRVSLPRRLTADRSCRYFFISFISPLKIAHIFCDIYLWLWSTRAGIKTDQRTWESPRAILAGPRKRTRSILSSGSENKIPEAFFRPVSEPPDRCFGPATITFSFFIASFAHSPRNFVFFINHFTDQLGRTIFIRCFVYDGTENRYTEN